MVVDEYGNEVDPGVETAPVKDAKDASPAAADFSPPLEDQQTELNAAQRSVGAKPQGFDARGYAEGVARNIDAANEKARQKFFKDNQKGYERFLGFCSYRDAAEIETAMKYEAAQLRHAATAQEQQAAADIVTNLVKLNSENAAAGQVRKWAAVESAQATKQALDGQAERNAGEAKVGLDKLGDAGKTAAAVVDGGVESFKASTYADYASAAAGADEEWERGCESLYNFNANELARFRDRVVKMSLNSGDPLNVASAKADMAVRQAAVGILNGLLANGNHDVFSRWMHRLNGTSISEEVEDGAGGVAVKYDAMKRWCLGGGDLKGLADAYIEAKMRERRIAKLEADNGESDMIKWIEGVRARAGRLFGGQVGPAEQKALNGAMDELQRHITSGDATDKSATRAREAIEHIQSKLESRMKSEERIQTKVAKMESKNDFIRVWNELESAEDSTKSVVLLTGSGDSERAIEVSGDIRHVKSYLLDQAFKYGLASGQAWTDEKKALEKATDEDLREQRDAFSALRDELGLQVITPDKDSDMATAGARNKKTMRKAGAYDELLEIDDRLGSYVSKNKNLMWRWKKDGVWVTLTSDDINTLLTKSAAFQRKHKDAKTEDIVRFGVALLDSAASIHQTEKIINGFADTLSSWTHIGNLEYRSDSESLGKMADGIIDTMVGENSASAFSRQLLSAKRVIVDQDDVNAWSDAVKAAVDSDRKARLEKKKAERDALQAEKDAAGK